MDDVSILNKQFLDAVKEVSADSLRCEISEVLNKMPLALRVENNFESDKELINEIDKFINQLYQEGRLTFPAHRWLSSPNPKSSLKPISQSFEYGSLFRNTLTNCWEWTGGTTYFCMMEFEADLDDLN